MKKVLLVLVAVLAVAGMASAQVGTISQTTDILGAHLGYGRGCVMCHAPHSGAGGNGVATTDTGSGNVALWGQDLTPLYGKPLNFGDPFRNIAVTLPSSPLTSPFDANTTILLCLSCHDGNLAKVGMMRGHTVETLPIVGGTAPTLLGHDGTVDGNYYNDHPVGAKAYVSCGGRYDWDCNGGGNTTTAISFNGPNSTVFLTNYPGSFWNGGASLGTYAGVTVNAVTCISCHDQHSNFVYENSKGPFATTFFVRGNYVPSTGGNNAAQFCRNCHGGEANEMHGVLSVPTT